MHKDEQYTYVGLSDDQKFELVQNVMDDLKGKHDVGVCGCDSCKDTPYVHGSFPKCPECGKDFEKRRPMNAWDFCAFNEVSKMAFVTGGKHNLIGGLFMLPWDAVINTATDTIQVQCKGNHWETFNLPPRKDWAFSFNKFLETEANAA